jgi:hypothetical protein
MGSIAKTNVAPTNEHEDGGVSSAVATCMARDHQGVKKETTP